MEFVLGAGVLLIGVLLGAAITSASYTKIFKNAGEED